MFANVGLGWCQMPIGWRPMSNIEIPRPCVQSLFESVCHWPRHFPYAHMPCQMHASLGWCCMPLEDIFILMFEGYEWYLQATTMFHVSTTMCVGYGWYWQATFDSDRPICHCVQAKEDAGRQSSTISQWCAYQMADASCLCLLSPEQFEQN